MNRKFEQIINLALAILFYVLALAALIAFFSGASHQWVTSITAGIMGAAFHFEYLKVKKQED